jgi:predicted mannosyl-3-phosphoglycerate phosphatase (HAD superfamily)
MSCRCHRSSPAQASLARLQEASETLIWRDSDGTAFDAELAQLGLRFVQGRGSGMSLMSVAGRSGRKLVTAPVSPLRWAATSL